MTFEKNPEGVLTIKIGANEYLAASMVATWEAFGQCWAFNAPDACSIGAITTTLGDRELTACRRRIDLFLEIAQKIKQERAATAEQKASQE